MFLTAAVRQRSGVSAKKPTLRMDGVGMEMRIKSGQLYTCMTLVGLALITGSRSAAAVALRSTSVSEAVQLNYDLDAALTYIDAYQQLPVRAALPPLSGGATPSTGQDGVFQPRTLGLRHLRIGLDWHAATTTNFRVVFRPDAVNRQIENSDLTTPREFDSRSGDPGMKPLPTIRLLDAYQLTYRVGTGLIVGAGVWENFGVQSSAYPELLGFGLNVIFPAKFAGIMINWQPPGGALDTAVDATASASPAAFGVRFYAFLGDQDRAEGQNQHHGSFDTAPTAHDPNQGGALVLSWRLQPEFKLGFMAGYLDSGDTAGGYESVFGQLTGENVFVVAGHRNSVTLDARYEQTHGRLPVANQTLISGALKAATSINDNLAAILGVNVGNSSRWAVYSSQRTNTVWLQGHQIEGGLLHDVGRNLSLQFLISREYRTLRSGAQKVGGFQDADGSKSTIHRVGFEVAYRFNSNA